jgi:hypothetical protein
MLTQQEYDLLVAIEGPLAAERAADRAGGIIRSAPSAPSAPSDPFAGIEGGRQAAAMEGGAEWQALQRDLEAIEGGQQAAAMEGGKQWQDAMRAATPVIPTPVASPVPIPPTDPAALQRELDLISGVQTFDTALRATYGEPGSLASNAKIDTVNYQDLKSLVANQEFLLLYPYARTSLEARRGRGYSLNPNVRDVPYTDMTPGTYAYLVTKFVQTGSGIKGFNNEEIPGFGATAAGIAPRKWEFAVQGFFDEVKAWLEAGGQNTSDLNVYNNMQKIASDSGQSDEQFWWSRTVDDWRNQYYPALNDPAGDADADDAPAGDADADDAPAGDAPDMGEYFFPPETDAGTVPPGWTAEDWNALTPEKQAEYLLWEKREPDTPLTDPSVREPDTPLTGPSVPAIEGILAGVTPQETFPQDVFRRFLAQQGEPLSPFMQRGAQNLYPQLSEEYGFLPYMQSAANMFGQQATAPTFASWLEAGTRPSRGEMLGTLGDIGSVLSQGPAGTIGEGLSPAEMSRRGRIQTAFGTETPESRQQIQSMLGGAFMSGIAPAFRYPVQAGIQNVFQTQRALQPDKPFLSFLSERMS